jgi:hypothetical protein
MPLIYPDGIARRPARSAPSASVWAGRVTEYFDTTAIACQVWLVPKPQTLGDRVGVFMQRLAARRAIPCLPLGSVAGRQGRFRVFAQMTRSPGVLARSNDRRGGDGRLQA